jgi:hypothetical protein
MKSLVIRLAGALWLATAPVCAQGVLVGEFGSGVGFGPFDSYPADANTSAGYWGAHAWIDAFGDQEGVERHPVVVVSFAYARGRHAMAQGSRQDIERATATVDQH